MQTENILELIDSEISQLQQARALLTGDTGGEQPAKHRGRPKGSTKQAKQGSAPVAAKQAKRTMSEEGKARIAAAQRARWAAQKGTAKKSSLTPAKKAATSAVKPQASKKTVGGKKKAVSTKSALSVAAPAAGTSTAEA